MEGAKAGLLLIDPDKVETTYALRFDFLASNNETEYEALVAGLQLTIKIGAKTIQVFEDSQLMVRQVDGSYDAKDTVMKKYRDKVRSSISHFDSFRIDRIPRSQNRLVEALSKLASSGYSYLIKEVFVEGLPWRSIEEREVEMVVERGALPQKVSDARSLRMKAVQYAYKKESCIRKLLVVLVKVCWA